MLDSPYTTVAVILLMALLFAAERVVPLRRHTRPLVGRLLVNVALSALMLAVAMLWVRPAARWALQWASDAPVGLVHIVPLSGTAQFVVSFLLMDLTFYWWHVANHRIPLLWRFHNVHHIDPDLDVSTAFRFHFGELVLSAGFRVVQVSAIGLSAWMFAVYELAFQANTLFHHSNVRLPIRIERLLNLVLVTPRMHGIHHSQVRDETQSNFSVVFSWWDRLHRTLGLDIPHSSIVIGVPGYSDAADNRLWNALMLPFRPQRHHWIRPDGSTPPRASSKPADARGDREGLGELQPDGEISSRKRSVLAE